MTRFYVVGPSGRDKASLEFQLWDSGDECAARADDLLIDEFVLMPDAASIYRQVAAERGLPAPEAHRELTRGGTSWRLVYDVDDGDEDRVTPVDMVEMAYRLAEKEIERHCDQHPVFGDAKNDDGLYVAAPSSMKTWLGRRLDVLNVTPDDVNVYDIAHALARQCRYNGHVENFLSVARHSVWVSTRLRNETPELQLWGLLHDASEAFIGDMIKPLKHSPAMSEFIVVEEQVERAIAEAYRLPFPMPDIVKEADKFVTIQVEIGMGLRETHVSTYDEDEQLFLKHYERLGW